MFGNGPYVWEWSYFEMALKDRLRNASNSSLGVFNLPAQRLPNSVHASLKYFPTIFLFKENGTLIQIEMERGIQRKDVKLSSFFPAKVCIP
jgi:hypothetical protein